MANQIGGVSDREGGLVEVCFAAGFSTLSSLCGLNSG